MTRSPVARALALATALALWASPALAQEHSEDANLAKSGERAAEHQTPEYQAELRERSIENGTTGVTTQAMDPERFFVADLCWSQYNGCAGDIRLYDFQEAGRGLVEPVLFTARNGSTISGHVWATKAGPEKRPVVVITNGSIQAPEQLYWWAAQTLAKAGYVVLTSDPQGQGRSDLLGAGTSTTEGVHSQTTGNTFFDGTQDAIDFALSTPAEPYCPRSSRAGESHCAKQQRRVADGRNAAHNPFHALVDPTRVGIAGHSYGASGVSWVGQQDTRVDAVVAWDNLCGGPATCSRGGQGDPPPPRVPSLGMAGDYFAGTERKRSAPDPGSESVASRFFSEAGVDSGQIVIRGGTHFEWSYIPHSGFRATLRGIDMASWYTTAWFDRYVKGDPTADDRLLSTRWQRDPGDLRVDPAGGGNLFSYHYLSRMDVRRADGVRVTCEDLRTGCEGLVRDDGEPAEYSYLAIATSPDENGSTPGSSRGTEVAKEHRRDGARAPSRAR